MLIPAGSLDRCIRREMSRWFRPNWIMPLRLILMAFWCWERMPSPLEREPCRNSLNGRFRLSCWQMVVENSRLTVWPNSANVSELMFPPLIIIELIVDFRKPVHSKPHPLSTFRGPISQYPHLLKGWQEMPECGRTLWLQECLHPNGYQRKFPRSLAIPKWPSHRIQKDGPKSGHRRCNGLQWSCVLPKENILEADNSDWGRDIQIICDLVLSPDKTLFSKTRLDKQARDGSGTAVILSAYRSFIL